MTRGEMVAIIAAIAYKPGWQIQLGTDRDHRPYLQLAVNGEAAASLDAAARDGSRAPWKSGKRYLSSHMCRQEVVGAAFALIRDAEEHEMREWFRYRGAPIFCPHLDPDVLAEVARKADAFDLRDNSMTMAEA